MAIHPAIKRPSERLAVLVSVLKSVASYRGGVDPGHVLADVMTDLGMREEDVGTDVHMAIFTLCGGSIMETNTPSLIGQHTKVRASKRLAEWINDRHVPYDDGEAA